ncbi:MAG TPA: YfhO family protein [Desulfuromonadaceae bacterium]|jgi:hypothetical protein
MTDRKKDLLFIMLLFSVLVACFSRVLFTDQIIRAPDIINEYYWGVVGSGQATLKSLFSFNLSSAGWDTYINSGSTNLGGMASMQFLLHHRLIYWFISPPASVAWFMALHLFFGAVGTYCYCRAVGCSRIASFVGGLVFALSTENASLINAGHVLKIATISFAPWAFYFMERGYRTLRPIYFFTAAVVLAFQFFNIHWQIAFYTCLSLAVYGIARSIWLVLDQQRNRGRFTARMLGLNVITLVFFLSCVAISLAPLAVWSKDTNRGAQSGANQGKGGLDREEAMAWSMPPEETAAFIVPGMYGFSRQEAGENPTNIPAYYWGRMVFTQTLTYMGLLPWLLLPLPLLFRRDRVTQIALIVLAFGVLFSMGKYTPFYNLLYDHFPGINRFRVPKMMMFIPVFAMGILAARGVDILGDDDVLKSSVFRKYLYGVSGLAGLLGIMFVVERFAPRFTVDLLLPQIAQATRYEEGGYLIEQRWQNLVNETALAAVLAALCAAVLYARYRFKLGALTVALILVALYVGDLARVNSKFMFTVPVPEHVKGKKTAVMDFLLKDLKKYRVLPMDGSDPMQFASNKIPVMFTSNPVQQKRWQEMLDVFNVNSILPDMLNVKYLLVSAQQYEKEREQFGNKFVPVFRSPEGGQFVLENKAVLPKAWLVPSVVAITDQNQRLAILSGTMFNPRQIALVEGVSPIQLADPNAPPAVPPGEVQVVTYNSESIDVTAHAATNALLVLGEKYFQGWYAFVDGKQAEIVPVNHVLRGVYLTSGSHNVEFRFNPLAFRIGKYLTLGSFALFVVLLVREWLLRRRGQVPIQAG